MRKLGEFIGFSAPPETLLAARARIGAMEDEIQKQLRDKGADLREQHGDDVIRDVIREVEELEDEDSEVTAELLREMTGITT
jgi:hypothetical protein